MKITICGSMAFKDEMDVTRKKLVELGHEVKIPELTLEVPKEIAGGKKPYFGQYIEECGGIDNFPAGHKIWNLKEGAIRDHYEKIDWAESILVINHDKRGIKGYIGGNTLMEIGVAFYSKKPIFILNPVSSEISYKQEILGMKPIIINGQLELIK